MPRRWRRLASFAFGVLAFAWTSARAAAAEVFRKGKRACECPGWSVLRWREVGAHSGAVRVH